MASIAGSLSQTTFAAVPFAGAGYLFWVSIKTAMRRHNKALEDLSKAKELFYENEVKQHDRI